MIRSHIRCNHCMKMVFMADTVRVATRELQKIAAKAGWVFRTQDGGLLHFCPECKFLVLPTQARRTA